MGLKWMNIILRQAGRQASKQIIPEPESKQQRIHMEFSDDGTASF